jgi:hypothetical protein
MTCHAESLANYLDRGRGKLTLTASVWFHQFHLLVVTLSGREKILRICELQQEGSSGHYQKRWRTRPAGSVSR